MKTLAETVNKVKVKKAGGRGCKNLNLVRSAVKTVKKSKTAHITCHRTFTSEFSTAVIAVVR
jgi:hypothetical protein